MPVQRPIGLFPKPADNGKNVFALFHSLSLVTLSVCHTHRVETKDNGRNIVPKADLAHVEAPNAQQV